MAKKKKLNRDEVLRKFSSYVMTLAQSISDNTLSRPPEQPWFMFSKPEDGSVELSGKEAFDYYEIFGELTEAVDSELISRKAVDDFLKGAILATIDINNRRPDTTIQSRLDESIKNIRKQLAASPTHWQVYMRVSGLEPGASAQHFGNTRFLIFDRSQHFNQHKDAIQQSDLAEDEKDIRLELLKTYTEDYLDGQCVAIVEVDALDVVAARAKALKELRLTIDVINFYSDQLYRPRWAYLSLLEDVERKQDSVPVYTDADPSRISHSLNRIGRLENFNLDKLLRHQELKAAARRTSDILAKKSRTEIEERLLSAMQWAGRAAVDERNEESFLLHAIALESLIMERGGEPELGYRLRMRIAHLLGKNLETRKRFKEEVSRLYAIRSAIVHQGKYLVPDADLQLIRFFAKSAIMKVLCEEPFTLFKSDQELLSWFDEQLLK